MRRDPSSLALASQALRLRAWTLGVLAGAPARPAPAVEPAAWSLFFRVEGCALGLRRALAASGASSAPGAGAAELESAARGELQRVLSARAQLAALDRLAAREGWRIVVLKGGAAAQDAEPLDLSDLDLLVAPAQAAPLLAALDRAGYAAHGVDREAPGPRDHHYAPRWMRGALAIEVHFRLPEAEGEGDLLDGALPLPGSRALLRLSPGDHVRHLLLHAVVHHPQRRGRIRDLLLLASALGEAAGEGERARAALSRHPFALQLHETLRAAEDLARGRRPADRWTRASGAAYLLAASGWVGRLSAPRRDELAACVSAVVGCAQDRRRVWTRVWSRPAHASELAALAWLEHRAGAGGRALRTSARAVRYAAALAAALPLSAGARRAERAARAG